MLFFFNDTATTEIYTLSLHDALPIEAQPKRSWFQRTLPVPHSTQRSAAPDRKSTRLNSSPGYSSYAVFCLKKKNKATFTPPSQNARYRQPTVVEFDLGI